MNIESIVTKSYEITGERLDPVRVIVQAIGPGRGRIIIECFGQAWAAYWGAMGQRTLQEFFSQCDTPYLINALAVKAAKMQKHERDYLRRIVELVKRAFLANRT